MDGKHATIAGHEARRTFLATGQHRDAVVQPRPVHRGDHWSVLLQGYPNLESIVIDGGSTDESVEIIRKNEQWLAFWVSESDWGQAHAINKGFSRATGQILAWLNSDNTY